MKYDDILTKKIYNTFINPIYIKKQNFIGIELEFPIINLDKKPVDVCMLQKIMNLLITNYNFKKLATDKDERIYSIQNSINKDIICFECSYNTLEFSMYRDKDIVSISKRFYDYFNIINKILISKNHTMTGLGFNPYYKFTNSSAIKNNRYEKIYSLINVLKKYSRIGQNNNLFSYICSAQTHLDIDLSYLTKFLNVISKIEWIKAILFSNSLNPDFNKKNKNCLCVRDLIYKNSIFSSNKNNTNGFDIKLNSVNDLIDNILDRSIYYVYRNNTFIFFNPIKLKDYFNQKNFIGYKFTYKDKIQKIKLSPLCDDIQYFRSYKPLEITKLGTVEIRSDCQQSLNRTFSPSAFCIGILENLDQTEQYINKYFPLILKKYSNSQLREIFIYENNIINALKNSEIFKFIKDIIFMSYDGLKKRNFGEEIFLKYLIENIDNLDSPAMKMVRLINENYSIEKIIQIYSKFKQ